MQMSSFSLFDRETAAQVRFTNDTRSNEKRGRLSPKDWWYLLFTVTAVTLECSITLPLAVFPP